ncbi:MAG: hypothetical protein J6W35_01785 [Eubacterium sp.]|nr:hypothetical protein [Eubacterium sp.]
MSRAKKILATLIVMTMVATSITVGAATQSPAKKKIPYASVSVTAKPMTYNKTAQVPVIVKVVVDNRVLIEGTDYLVVVAKVTNAGKYIVTTQVIGIGHYEGTVTKKVTVTVNKAKQKLKNTKKRKIKYKKVKKKKVKIKLKVKSTGTGKIKYKRVSKKLKVSKKGKVTIKKGTKKGTYKVKVKALANGNYKATKWKKIKIRIK